MGHDKKYGAIILAAGYSSRMGAFKPLLDIEGTNSIERLISQSKKAGMEEIVLVTGYQRQRLQRYREEGKVTLVYNQNYNQGMFTSIKAGIEKIKKDKEGIFLLPVDCPLISSETLRHMKERVGGEFAVPTFLGKKGHPLFIPKKYFEEILSYRGEEGLKGITRKYLESMDYLEVDKEEILMDMDTQEDYHKICIKAGKKNTDIPLKEMVKGRRIFLIRHGQIVQHKEKIFLGQRDLPLSEKGRKEGSLAGDVLRDHDVKVKKVYTGTLKRTIETGTALNLAPLDQREGLNEMALGAWDGQYISTIKERYPEEYRRRGENIWRYKFDHKSENFYDLQYRVYKELYNILKEDNGEDLIIVSHKGCLRVIENLLKGKRVEDSWQLMGTGQVRII